MDLVGLVKRDGAKLSHRWLRGPMSSGLLVIVDGFGLYTPYIEVMARGVVGWV